MIQFSDAPPMSFEELDAFLQSDDAPEDCMMVSDLDGFLTAVAIGPELIRPSEWLPVVWGEKDPEFSSGEQLQRVLGAILGRYNEILDILAHDPESFEPVFWVNETAGVMIAADWAEGFMDGMRLRPGGWQALLKSDDAKYLAPIVAFGPEAESGPLASPDAVEQIARLRESAADLIPVSVARIHGFFKKTRGFFEGASTLGRNWPCFCGSGKKFKICCGRGRV